MKQKNQIANFPHEVVEKMLERQVEQGRVRDVSVFQKDKASDSWKGGFTWVNTPEGDKFWEDVIDNEMFDVFFDKYPCSNNDPIKSDFINITSEIVKTEKHELRIGTPRIVKSVSNGNIWLFTSPIDAVCLYSPDSNIHKVGDTISVVAYDNDIFEDVKDICIHFKS